jgi:hypothetical protein
VNLRQPGTLGAVVAAVLPLLLTALSTESVRGAEALLPSLQVRAGEKWERNFVADWWNVCSMRPLQLHRTPFRSPRLVRAPHLACLSFCLMLWPAAAAAAAASAGESAPGPDILNTAAAAPESLKGWRAAAGAQVLALETVAVLCSQDGARAPERGGGTEGKMLMRASRG